MWIHWRSFSPNGSLPSPTLLILHRVHLGVFWQQATQSGRATRKATGNSVSRGWPGLETLNPEDPTGRKTFPSMEFKSKFSKSFFGFCEMFVKCPTFQMIMAIRRVFVPPRFLGITASSVDRGNRFWNCCKHGCSSDIRDMAKWNTGDFRMFSGCSFSCFWCFFLLLMAPTLWLYTVYLFFKTLPIIVILFGGSTFPTEPLFISSRCQIEKPTSRRLAHSEFILKIVSDSIISEMWLESIVSFLRPTVRTCPSKRISHITPSSARIVTLGQV